MSNNEVEEETIGDWAGHTPTTETEAKDRVLMARGIAKLVHAAGSNSRGKGFHDDWPAPGYPIVTATGEPAADVRAELVEGHELDVRRAIAEKLALIHEEISEALGEIRSGKATTEVYYSNVIKLPPVFDAISTEEHRTWKEQDWEPIDDALPNDGSRPVLKPEGFGVELADAVIRIADLAYLTGLDLGALILEKMTYNGTRPHKHGRKF